MNVPDNLKYTSDHEWVLVDGDIALVGITDHAQEELTDVVFVELPERDKTFDQGDAVGVIESVKAASDIYAAISGEIVEVNDDLTDDPSLINADPFGDGWIYKISINLEAEVEALMSPEDYEEFIS